MKEVKVCYKENGIISEIGVFKLNIAKLKVLEINATRDGIAYIK